MRRPTPGRGTPAPSLSPKHRAPGPPVPFWRCGCCRPPGKLVVTFEIDNCDTGVGTKGGPGDGGPPQPVPTPYLVIPCLPGDPGTRPISTALALTSQAIQVTFANPDAPGGWHDSQIQLSCVVANLGAVASATTMIEFYTGAAVGIWSPGHDTLTPAEVRANVGLCG